MLTYAGEAPIQALTSNYRFFFKFERLPGTYIYYQINHGFESRDLHIVVRLSFGTLDILVSNVEKYPSRSLENVAWKSRASIGDPAIESGKLTYSNVFCHTSYIDVYKSRASIGDPAIESGNFICVQTFDDAC
jgi:hypothetical protein